MAKESRRERIFEILDNLSADLDYKSDSPLGILAQPAEIDVFIPKKVVILFGLLIVLSGILLIVAFTFAESQLVRIAAGGVGILVLVMFLLVLRSSRERIKAIGSDASRALEELSELTDSLTKYLSGLDNRTSRYFHCVTVTKVTTFFVLTQAHASLKQRVAEIEYLLDSPRDEDVLAAYEKLKTPLVFSDGATPTSGNMHALPLHRIKVTMGQLIEDLESGLTELEDELT